MIRAATAAPAIALLLCVVSLALAAQEPPMKASPLERTCFQTASPWKPEIDIKSDVAIVYGVNESLAERMSGWRQRGYRIHLMTGIAWGVGWANA